MVSSVKAQDVAQFSEQLALMLGQAVPIQRALELCSVSCEPALGEILHEVEQKVVSGQAFSRSISKYRDEFGSTFVTMVRVGEQTGAMVDVLNSLGRTLRQQGETRARVMSAMAYPSVVLASSSLMIMFLVGYMLPNFVEILPSGESGELPFLTQIVLGFFTSPIVVRGVPLALVVLGFITFQMWRSDYGRWKIRKMLSKLPLFGALSRQFALVGFCRNLYLLRQGGLDLFKSLSSLSSETSGDPGLDVVIGALKRDVMEGADLSKSMAKHDLFPKMLTMMVMTGEESGRLDYVLQKYAEIGEEDLQTRIDTLVALIEPLTMAVVGLIVGVILIATFLPTYQLIMNVS